MKTAHALAALVASIAVSLAAHVAPSDPPTAAATAEELTAKPWLYEVVRHLYRWYIDERDVDALVKSGTVTFWVREIKPALDEGDRSRFGEVILPQLSLAVRVKRADYAIPELNLTVKCDRFKITSVGHIDVPERMPEGYTSVSAVYAEMREELFKTRSLASFPEGELLEHMRAAARKQILKEAEHVRATTPAGPQIVHLAPLSPIANEAWAFWEGGRMLIRFASDIDLADPAVWEHEDLMVHVYPLDRNVVVSLDEVAGSNAFMTRDQAGRALFNCVVLGKKIELQPPAPNPTQ